MDAILPSGFLGLSSIEALPDPSSVDPSLVATGQRGILRSAAIANRFWLRYRSNGAFESGKSFSEDERSFSAIDGVITGIPDSGVFSESAACGLLLDQGACNAAPRLRGSYSLLSYDKTARRLELSTNHMGTRPLFYYHDTAGKRLFFGSNALELARLMRSRGIAPSIDELGARYMLTFGYMLDDLTLVEGMHRLAPGTSLCFDPEGLEIKTWWHMEIGDDDTMKLDDAVDGMHGVFSSSLSRCLDRIRSDGYQPFSLMSGGLDTRAIEFYCERAGVEDLGLLTFGETGSHDVLIAQEAARTCGYPIMHRSLDTGSYLLDVESPVRLNGGLIFHAGSAHALAALRDINWSGRGMLLNGNLADAMHGDYVDGPEHTAPNVESWASSRRLLPTIAGDARRRALRYRNAEDFAIYNRGVNAIFNGNMMALPFTEPYEPFLDPEVLEFSAKMPARFKFREYAFVLMLNRYVPGATGIRWEKWNRRPTRFGAKLFRNGAYAFVKKGLGYVKRNYLPPSRTSSMNPMAYWMKTNPKLGSGLEAAFQALAAEVPASGELWMDCRGLFESGNLFEKSMSLTLMQAYQDYGF
jgi:asparagine synthase (glutamine-hydrolysing)